MSEMYDNYYDHTRPGNPRTISLDAAGPFPADNAVREYTKPTAPEGFHPGWSVEKNKWVDLEDHIGKQGYVDGESVTIKEYGPLPDGWSDTPPEPPFHPGPDYEEQEDGSWLRVRYTKKDFMLWCGIDKMLAMNRAIEKGNYVVKTMLDLLMASEFISIKDPATTQMLGVLITPDGGSLLTLEEMQRILAGEVWKGEAEAA